RCEVRATRELHLLPFTHTLTQLVHILEREREIARFRCAPLLERPSPQTSTFQDAKRQPRLIGTVSSLDLGQSLPSGQQSWVSSISRQVHADPISRMVTS